MEQDPSLRPTQAAFATRSARGALTLWLAAAALALVFVVLFVLFDAQQQDISNLQAAVVEAQSARVLPVPIRDIAVLRTTAAEAVAVEESLQAAITQAAHGGVPWPAALQRLVPAPPSEVRLTSLTQHQGRLVVQGIAANELALATYVARLQGSLLFDSVQLESATLNFAISLQVKEYQP